MKEILFKPEETYFLKHVLDDYNKSHSEKYSKMSKSILGKLERAEKKIKTSSAKGKGRNLQYWVCERIAEMFGIKFVQSDDECLIQSRPMGQHSVDIILRGELKKKFPFSIECKAQENLSLSEWIRQAKENELPETNWMLIFKKQTIGKPIVCLDFETFLKYYSK